MNPNDLIDTIVDAIDYAELAHDTQGLVKARRLLNNDLRQAIDLYVQDEINRELLKRMKAEKVIFPARPEVERLYPPQYPR